MVVDVPVLWRIPALQLQVVEKTFKILAMTAVMLSDARRNTGATFHRTEAKVSKEYTIE